MVEKEIMSEMVRHALQNRRDWDYGKKFKPQLDKVGVEGVTADIEEAGQGSEEGSDDDRNFKFPNEALTDLIIVMKERRKLSPGKRFFPSQFGPQVLEGEFAMKDSPVYRPSGVLLSS